MTFKQITTSIFYMICFIFILNVIQFNDDNLYINDNCQFNEEEEGICKYLTECESSKNNLIKFNIKPKICSFNRHQPIICCQMNGTENIGVVTEIDTNIDITMNKSDIGLRQDNTEKRISERKCSDLYDSKYYKAYGGRRTKRDTMTTKMFSKFDILHQEDYNRTTQQITIPQIAKQSPIFQPPTTPIAGGKSVFYKEYPFMVAIGWETFDNGIEFKCGGSLVETNFVVTAAHCIDIGGAKPKVIRTGGVDLDKDYLTNDDITISKIFVHPNYTKTQNYNDIALIQLTKHSYDTPACLYSKHEIDEKFLYAKAIGYGQTQFAGPSSNKLLQIQINLIKNKDCNIYYPPDEKYPRSIIETQICAFDPKQVQDTCPGDSGGPVFIEETTMYKKVNLTYLIGVTSFGKYCASDSPGVYTRISTYLDWIESIVWSDEII